MADRRMVVFAAALLFAVSAAFGQSSPAIVGGSLPGAPDAGSRRADAGAPLAFQIQPLFALPLSDSADVFSYAGGLGIGLEYGFTGNPQPFLTGSVDYAYLPVEDGSSSVSMLSAMAGGGLYFWLSPRLGARVSGIAGYYYGYTNDGDTASGQTSFDAGARLEYMLTPSVNVSLGAGYRYSMGTFQGLTVSAGTSLFLSGRSGREKAIAEARRSGVEAAEARTPEKGRGIEFAEIELAEIFPVFHKYYDENPVGKAVLFNQEKASVTDVKLQFFVKQYMDSPKQCPAPAVMAAGERKTVDIMSLLTDRILDVTEATKIAAELSLEYRMGGELYRDRRTVTVRVMDRNAMTWDDDRKAAAFVTAKDPAVLAAAKDPAGLVRENAPEALNTNMTMAMGIFTAMELYGLSYVVDPKTPFVEFSKDKSLVDYLQFPRQTLGYKAGDCDDLSVLFAALLEAVGVETAFVTVPGHILMAFSTGLRPEEAARAFGGSGDIISEAGQAWIPVETTVRKGGFLKAWAEGVKQWKNASSRGTAGFFPVHQAWKTYEPVGLPGTAPGAALPDRNQTAAAFRREVALFVDREISPRIARLEETLRRTGGDPSTRNRLGILYAQYGRNDEAEAEFVKASAGEFLPALINLGNLALLRGRPAPARDFFERAARKAPDDPRILLGLSLSNRDTGRQAESRVAYEKLARVDGPLAERHAYLGDAAGAAGRASDTGAGPALVWAEE